MKKRKLVAALACRAGGSRLYGKPLQNLVKDYTILEYLIDCIQQTTVIDEIVLGISEGIENLIFRDIAHKKGVRYIVGDQKDVLRRLIDCGLLGEATDVFRVTTECPFVAWEYLDRAWQLHLENQNDITITDYFPEGINFEIYTLASLQHAHQHGLPEERSEFCSAYARRNPDVFQIQLIQPPKSLARLDLRFTVDYPEDLVLCRQAYRALQNENRWIPVDQIIAFADAHPEWVQLVQPFVDPTAIWGSVLTSSSTIEVA